MHKPWHSFIFGLFVFLSLAFMSLVFPQEGVALKADLKLSFPSMSKLFKTTEVNTEVSKIIESVETIDTTFKIEDPDRSNKKDLKTTNISTGKKESAENSSETLVHKEASEKSHKLITSIQTNNPAALKKFFDALYELKKNPTAIRVLHYGDSQIEGDRITDYLRLKFQGQFGGEGPGLITLLPVTPSVINKVNTSKGWTYYNVFTAKDKRVNHSNYGVLAGF